MSVPEPITVAWLTDSLELGGVVCSKMAAGTGVGGQWSVEGKANSLPERDAGLAQSTGQGEVVEMGWGWGGG